MQAPHQCAGAHFIAVLQGHHVLIAMDYTTVVAYINKQGGSHCHALLRLVVDLFLWLQTQDITLGARHIPCCLNVIADRLSWPNQPITTEWSLYPTSSSVYVSSSGASSTGDRYPVTGLAGEVDVHVSTVSPAQQSHSEDQDHSDRRVVTQSPLVTITTVVSTSTTSVCGPPTLLSIPPRPAVTTGIYLELQVVPSACMEALMHHYQAAGFLREVSKLTAAPRRPSTNRMMTTLVATLR